MYNVAWHVRIRNFVKRQMVVHAQRERIYSFLSNKLYDGAALIKYAKILSSCVNVLTHFDYVSDLNSDGVLDTRTEWLTYVKQMTLHQPGFVV